MCPLEAVRVLQDATDAILDAARADVWLSAPDSGDAQRTSRPLSSDDLLPLFLAATIQVTNMHERLAYLDVQLWC